MRSMQHPRYKGKWVLLVGQPGNGAKIYIAPAVLFYIETLHNGLLSVIGKLANGRKVGKYMLYLVLTQMKGLAYFGTAIFIACSILC